MTTAEPVTQARKTVPVQDMQIFSLGRQTDKPGPLAVVLGLGNVVATFCIAGSSPTQDLLLTITGLAWSPGGRGSFGSGWTQPRR